LAQFAHGESPDEHLVIVKRAEIVGVTYTSISPTLSTAMYDSEYTLRARLRWVKLYEELRNQKLVCRRCGISPPTLRKWWRRYQAEGEAGLYSRSRRPHNIQYKVTEEHIAWIRHMRLERKLGLKRIHAELIRLHGLKLSTNTIWKVLVKQGWRYLKKRKKPIRPKSYSRPVPGDRVQVDTVKVAKNLFQYTATDDCTRMRVLALYPRRNAKNSVRFLREHMLQEFPFPIQRIQTDRGGEFFGTKFQLALMEEKIKFRPIRPYSPHLNGKVERSQRTDWMEFYATVDVGSPELPAQLKQWQQFYNEERPHGGIGGQTPQSQWCRLADRVADREAVGHLYDRGHEDFRARDHELDSQPFGGYGDAG